MSVEKRVRGKEAMAKLTVDDHFCKGCGLCVDACPKNIMALDADRITPKGYHPAKCIDQDLCIACANCATMCPDVAIKVER